jgi:queuine tRNA-ribosyltransferase
MSIFTVIGTSGIARAGVLRTPHGEVSTPAFMPVGTQGSVKALTPEEVRAVGAEMVLANAYHLYLRPGVDLVRDFGGLHTFTGWDGPILTDSGGFQAFSLGALRKISDDGILFRSHIDGSEHFFSPESATRHQEGLGADIIMCLDQCIAYGESKDAVRRAMERTHRWAARCKDAHGKSDARDRQALFGIVQGGVFPDLRAESAQYITSMDFDGYAVGGLAVGEAKGPMYEVTGQVASLLPEGNPRYLMGVGSPEDLVECVSLGIDLFDCALPTRVARNGALFTNAGRTDITNRRYKEVRGPLQDGCDCYTCTNFSVAYLHHLFKAKELLALRLASIHNLRFVLRLMEDMRRSILENSFQSFKNNFMDGYKPTHEATRLSQKETWMEARNIRGG